MAGGIMDWCEDWYDERKVWKVVRGGHWAGASGLCRSVYRDRGVPDSWTSGNGFRLLLRPGALGSSGS